MEKYKSRQKINVYFSYVLFSVLVCLGFISLILLQLHNISLYPAKKGFDSLDHIQYINILKNEKRVPLANEAWETYQPPLYYFFSSFLPTVKSIQYMNFLTWISFCALTYIFVNKSFKNRLLGLLGAFLVGSLPMLLYITPMVSNEFFSSFIISLSLVYYLLKFKNKKNSSSKEDIILGLLLGLSLLSKATSLLLIVSIILDICIENKFHIKKVFSIVYKALFVSLIMGGWFYVRNFIYFKNPLVQSVDFFPANVTHQDPGYRDWKFFLDLSGFLKLDIFNAHHYSLWAGTYYSWFFDGHNALIPVQSYSKIGVMLVLSSLPLFCISVLGFIVIVRKITIENRILLIYPCLLFLSYIAYNFKLPYYSTVKAIFLTSAIIPWIVFVISGIKVLLKKTPFIWILIVYLSVYYFFIIKNFWVVGWWYNYIK